MFIIIAEKVILKRPNFFLVPYGKYNYYTDSHINTKLI